MGAAWCRHLYTSTHIYTLSSAEPVASAVSRELQQWCDYTFPYEEWVVLLRWIHSEDPVCEQRWRHTGCCCSNPCDWWQMHEPSSRHDPIQGQGHEPFKVGNPAIFNSYLLRHLEQELVIDHGFVNYGTVFDRAGFFLCFWCHVTLKFAETSVVKSRPSVPYGANLFLL